MDTARSEKKKEEDEAQRTSKNDPHLMFRAGATKSSYNKVIDDNLHNWGQPGSGGKRHVGHSISSKLQRYLVPEVCLDRLKRPNTD